MKVLFFVRLFYPHRGGVEKHVLKISEILLKKKITVTIVTEKYNSSLIEYEVYKGLHIYRVPIIRNVWFKKFILWWWLFKNISLIKTANIIHCHDVFYWYLPFRFLFFKKPVYTTFHGYESYPVKQKAVIVRRLSNFLSYGSLCVGEFIEKWYGTKGTYILYGGVDVKKFKVPNSVLPHRTSLDKQSLKFKLTKNSALFIGRLDEQTGILDYCKATAEIRKEFPNFEFVVAGDGPLRQEVEKYGNVLGFVKEPENMLVIHRFAFVSRYLAILEAMAAKRLVFALYDNPLKKDYLTNTPFARFIEIEKSPIALVKRVKYYIDNPEMEDKMVQKAYEFVKQYTWENIAAIYFQLWKIK